MKHILAHDSIDKVCNKKSITIIFLDRISFLGPKAVCLLNRKSLDYVYGKKEYKGTGKN